MLEPVSDTQKLLTTPPNDAGRLSYTPEHPPGLKTEICRVIGETKTEVVGLCLGVGGWLEGQNPGKWMVEPVPDTQKLLTTPPNDAGRLSYTPEHPPDIKSQICKAHLAYLNFELRYGGVIQ
jgi:hypothetical protein